MHFLYFMVKQNRSTPDCIKDCGFKQEKTSLLWDFVFSKAGMDWWKDDDGWIDICMDECDEQMDGWIDDGWWNGLQKQRIFKSPFCRACIVEIHRQPFNSTFDWVRTYSGKAMGWMAWTVRWTQTRTDKHIIKLAVSTAAQRHWSGGWVKGLAWCCNDGCPMNKSADDWLK